MDIKFTTTDYNIWDIKRDFNEPEDTKYSYRIYGLADHNNPPVLIKCDFDKFDKKKRKLISKFLSKRGLPTEIQNDEGNEVSLGIRKDVRKNINLCVALVDTVITHFEGLSNILAEKHSIGIPKFLQEKS